MGGGSAAGGGSANGGGSAVGGGSGTGGGGSADGGVTALPLGTLTVTQPSITCPMGVPTGAKCMTATVSCTGEPDISVTIADLEPTGAAKGTVIAHSGGSGTSFYNGNTGNSNHFSQSLTAQNLRFVQVAWANDWASTGHGIKAAGCRPATLFRWIFDNIHQGSRTTAFCGMGSSGGTAALLYSIAAYGLKDVWDYLQLAAGPTPSRLDYGCEPSLYGGGPRNLCPLLTDAPWQYDYVATGSSSIVNIANGWEGTNTCGKPSPPANDVATWASDGLVSAGDDYDYPQTSMSFWYCTSTPNMSTGQASFYIEQAQPKNGAADVNCYAGSCQNEEVFQDSSAYTAAVNAMVANCVPNH